MAEFMKHYKVLLNKAKVDLKAALNLHDDISRGDEELDYEVVLFHLHQCAEKFMKSLMNLPAASSGVSCWLIFISSPQAAGN